MPARSELETKAYNMLRALAAEFYQGELDNLRLTGLAKLIAEAIRTEIAEQEKTPEQ